MEIKALGIDYEVINELREFRILEATEEKKELIRKKGSYFKTVSGKYTDYFQIIEKIGRTLLISI
ncbi:MAG: hypothetical protein ACP5UA_03920 [Candidatus Hydrogenedens sp.]